MKTLRLIPLVIALAACSSVEIPMSPYRIDVQQGNALEQDSVDKLKVGMTATQVKFLLGTPLLVDPFRNNRWDYVYNFRKAGKLTEKKRLVLFFENNVLVRIDAEGFTPKPVTPVQEKPVVAESGSTPATQVAKSADKPVETQKLVTPEPVQVVVVTPVAAPLRVEQVAVAASIEVVRPVAAKTTSTEQSLNQTSIVPPLSTQTPRPTEPIRRPAPISEKPPEPVVLQQEINVVLVIPDAIPVFPDAPKSAGTTEEQVLSALNTWANAWKSKDEDAYLAAYAATFQPPGGLTRAEWEKRRRLLLGVSRNIDLKIDGHAFEAVTEDRTQVSFRQFYRSDVFQDAVIKQIKFVRVDNLWLIEEEKVLAAIKAKK